MLISTNAQAILIELAFITNDDDMRKLLNNKQKVISAIVRAVTGTEVPGSAGKKKIVTGGMSLVAINEILKCSWKKGFGHRFGF
ncbi:N-acetylmuramoyl-L-alanine amidase [Paenibacillus larvae]|uniref:N-acetylmuramoyl-L-alanine amidase n=1 Tax=Paenibacillus larvae TaxID=1464 RepID=UPI002282D5EC|nr:N-acetylmuramoyl-L-alanine amidase [Paenibacillus larvae]MCY9511817.1 N-acetylmuramoyl-L-alanine amidase [Paenibacillus larvae]MCY9526849.1 N-acetylmuramoyl-L-alanine amidase [Paenibacillus larvae]